MSDEPAPQTGARPVVERHDIPGWGVDASPRNDPTYPMRDRAGDDSPGMNWRRPTRQASDVEILQSVEHNRRPAVFGTSTPPTAVSGAIRRAAFRYSESQWAHWLLLMLADRVNTVEGLVGDLARGKVPNLVDEMGLAAAWKHDRAACTRKLVATGAVAGVAIGVAVLLLREHAPQDRPPGGRRRG